MGPENNTLVAKTLPALTHMPKVEGLSQYEAASIIEMMSYGKGQFLNIAMEMFDYLSPTDRQITLYFVFRALVSDTLSIDSRTKADYPADHWQCAFALAKRYSNRIENLRPLQKVFETRQLTLSETEVLLQKLARMDHPTTEEQETALTIVFRIRKHLQESDLLQADIQSSGKKEIEGQSAVYRDRAKLVLSALEMFDGQAASAAFGRVFKPDAEELTLLARFLGEGCAPLSKRNPSLKNKCNFLLAQFAGDACAKKNVRESFTNSYEAALSRKPL